MAYEHFEIGGLRYFIDTYPSQCPICHYAISPIYVKNVGWSDNIGRVPNGEMVFRCPRPECMHLFISRYGGKEDWILTRATTQGTSGRLKLRESVPTTFIKPRISEEVETVSSMFPLIYAQASAAESYGLDQVTGVAYRKALEFLIKDYCIKQHPNADAQIRSILLGKCIDQYVDSPQIKACAKRAAWLGNDETHYERKWGDKDIEDLKILLRLTMNWIESSILTQKYETEMP